MRCSTEGDRIQNTGDRIQETVRSATVPTKSSEGQPLFSKRGNSSLCQREVGRDFQSVRQATVFVIPAKAGIQYLEDKREETVVRSQNPEGKDRRNKIGVSSQEPEVRMKRKPAKIFQDLIVWQKAHEFVLSIYRFSNNFPKTEMYGLISQFRRAAISIAANIAEGFKKKTKPDKVRFMNIAQGSLEECRYYLILVKDLGYGDTSILMAQLEEVSKLLEAYIVSILTPGS